MTFSGGFGRVFRPVFDPGLAARNGLLNALIAYWPLNEAAGANNALDLHSNGLTLTQVGNPGATTGKIYATARQTYVATQTDCHFNRSDNLLRPGDTDFTFAAWVNLTVTDALTRGVLGTWQANPNSEFVLLKTADNKANWLVAPTGDPASTSTPLISTDALETATWYLIICQHDSVNNVLTLQINNGTQQSVAHTTGVAIGTGVFRLARFWTNDGAQATRVWRGVIGPVAFWKSAAGGGGVLSSSQRNALWNGGAGLAYANFTT